MALIGKPRE